MGVLPIEVQKYPENDEVMLAWAQARETLGDVEYATFIRTQIELSARVRQGTIRPDHATWVQREQRLLAAYRDDWSPTECRGLNVRFRRGLPDGADPEFVYFHEALRIGLQVSRGWVYIRTMETEDLVQAKLVRDKPQLYGECPAQADEAYENLIGLIRITQQLRWNDGTVAYLPEPINFSYQMNSRNIVLASTPSAQANIRALGAIPDEQQSPDLQLLMRLYTGAAAYAPLRRSVVAWPRRPVGTATQLIESEKRSAMVDAAEALQARDRAQAAREARQQRFRRVQRQATISPDEEERPEDAPVVLTSEEYARLRRLAGESSTPESKKKKKDSALEIRDRQIEL